MVQPCCPHLDYFEIEEKPAARFTNFANQFDIVVYRPRGQSVNIDSRDPDDVIRSEHIRIPYLTGASGHQDSSQHTSSSKNRSSIIPMQPVSYCAFGGDIPMFCGTHRHTYSSDRSKDGSSRQRVPPRSLSK